MKKPSNPAPRRRWHGLGMLFDLWVWFCVVGGLLNLAAVAVDRDGVPALGRWIGLDPDDLYLLIAASCLYAAIRTLLGLAGGVESGNRPTLTRWRKRAESRARARSLSGGSGWLAQVLDHHEQIEAAFAAVQAASTTTARRDAQRRLATLLTGHSMAEEAVLYPAMALGEQKAHSAEAYTEQSGAKVQTAGLDDLDPMSQDYLDKLEHLRSAVSMHVYREESDWFPELRTSGDATKQAKLSRRYKEEFERYMGVDAARG